MDMFVIVYVCMSRSDLGNCLLLVNKLIIDKQINIARSYLTDDNYEIIIPPGKGTLM